MSIRMFTITDKNGKRREVSEGIYRELFGGDADDVLEDGERVKVPLHLRDGQPFHSDADPRFAAVTDAFIVYPWETHHRTTDIRMMEPFPG